MTAITDRGMIFGTAEYMAPEQARGDEADARSDVYSLGVVLYELLTGRVPFRERSPIATMTAHLTREVPALRAAGSAPPSSDDGRPSVPRALEAVVLRAMAKEPAARWPSARALVDALRAAQDQRRVVSRSSVDALELGETMPAGGTGALRRSQILRAAAEHARQASESRARAELASTLSSAAPDAEARRGGPEPPRRAGLDAHPRLWIVAAIVLALLCVGVGVLVGAR
jgi:serine/threonine-protein kinase